MSVLIGAENGGELNREVIKQHPCCGQLFLV